MSKRFTGTESPLRRCSGWCHLHGRSCPVDQYQMPLSKEKRIRALGASQLGWHKGLYETWASLLAKGPSTREWKAQFQNDPPIEPTSSNLPSWSVREWGRLDEINKMRGYKDDRLRLLSPIELKRQHHLVVYDRFRGLAPVKDDEVYPGGFGYAAYDPCTVGYKCYYGGVRYGTSITGHLGVATEEDQDMRKCDNCGHHNEGKPSIIQNIQLVADGGFTLNVAKGGNQSETHVAANLEALLAKVKAIYTPDEED